jgi:molybdopterin-biosynthesis enzyme MoeA-like protein
VELNQKYLKINAMSMYKHQYKIFNFSDSSISKYLKHLKKSITEINCALVTYKYL